MEVKKSEFMKYYELGCTTQEMAEKLSTEDCKLNTLDVAKIAKNLNINLKKKPRKKKKQYSIVDDTKGYNNGVTSVTVETVEG